MKKQLLLLLGSLAVSSSFAATIQANTQVSSTVEKVCYLSTKDIVLGEIPITGYSGTHDIMAYKCSLGVTVTTQLNGNKDEVGRYMKVGASGQDKLRYNFTTGGRNPVGLFQEPSIAEYVGPVSVQSLVTVLPNQYVAPGNYVDQITVDISY